MRFQFLFGFNWYGFIIGAGMVLCLVLAYFMAKKRGYYSDLIFDIAIICIPLAIIGARLYYVIFDVIDGGEWTLKKFFGFGGEGLRGLAIYGGLIGAVIGGFIITLWKRNKPREKKASFLQMADLAFTLILLGQAIGRWGNFANQEAYGNAVTNPAWQWFPYAVYITEPKGLEPVGWYQATFFYESLWNAIGFALLMWFYNGKRKSFDGFNLSMYCIFYGVGRFFIEGLRSDSLWLVPGVVRVSQVVSAIIVVFGVAFVLYHYYKARETGKKPFILVDEKRLNDDYLWYDKSILSLPKAPPPAEEEDADLKEGYNGEGYEDDLYEDMPDIVAGSGEAERALMDADEVPTEDEAKEAEAVDADKGETSAAKESVLDKENR